MVTSVSGGTEEDIEDIYIFLQQVCIPPDIPQTKNTFFKFLLLGLFLNSLSFGFFLNFFVI